MSKNSEPQVPAPNKKLRALDKLVGRWRIAGGAVGRVTYRWMEGGHFLIQDFDLLQDGHTIRGIEIIGHLRPFGEGPSEDLRSRVYDNQGNTLDYVYEMDGDTLTIWGGEKGSPAYFKGKFTDADHNEGEWVYPGGGYKSTMTRDKE